MLVKSRPGPSQSEHSMHDSSSIVPPLVRHAVQYMNLEPARPSQLDRIGACTECLSCHLSTTTARECVPDRAFCAAVQLGSAAQLKVCRICTTECLHRSCPAPAMLWDNRALGSGGAGSHCLFQLRRSCSPKTAVCHWGWCPTQRPDKKKNKRRTCGPTTHGGTQGGGTSHAAMPPRPRLS